MQKQEILGSARRPGEDPEEEWGGLPSRRVEAKLDPACALRSEELQAREVACGVSRLRSRKSESPEAFSEWSKSQAFPSPA